VTEQELLDRISKYTPEAQKKILDEYHARTKTEPRVWYCKIGRSCNGEPHPGATYQHARGDQWPPPGVDWETWLMLSGRGGGKTRSGAEWVRSITKATHRIAIVAMDNRALRETVIEGESGLIYACENAGLSGYLWEPSKKKFTFPNGAVALGFSGEEPDSLRGPQFGAGWVDEGCHMPAILEVWSNLMLGMRLPGLPGGAKTLCTTTPLPVDWLVGDGEDGQLEGLLNEEGTVLVRVSSHANLKNLDDKFRKTLLKLEGTRKGRQEIYGEVLMDVPGALWKSDMLTYADEDFDWTLCEMIVIGVDPAGSVNKRSDDTGIIAIGLLDAVGYVLEDATGKYSPNEWAQKAIALFHFYSANTIVAEKNFGGDMVKSTIRNADPVVPVKVIQAQRSKQLRAEPIVTLYELGQIKHLKGKLQRLEDEMLRWVPGKGASPNRVDALVHAATHVMKGSQVLTMSRPGRRRINATTPMPRTGRVTITRRR